MKWKKAFFKVGLIAAIFFISSELSAQQWSKIYLQEWSKIYLKNGAILKGRIIEIVPEEKIKAVLKDGSIIDYQFSEILKIETIPISKKGSLGLGVGIPYGIIGINLEFAISKHLVLSPGIGTASAYGIAYNLGLKYYLRAIGNSSWRSRISMYYGKIVPVASYEVRKYEWQHKLHNGLTFGIGQQLMWGDKKRHGLDLDTLFIAASSAFADINVIENVLYIPAVKRLQLSIGYRYGF